MCCRTHTGGSAFSKSGREEIMSYTDPKNKFERALNDKPKQSIQGYRVKLLQSGFTSKARKSNGKTVLTLRALKG